MIRRRNAAAATRRDCSTASRLVRPGRCRVAEGGQAFNVVGLRKHVQRLHALGTVAEVGQQAQVAGERRGAARDVGEPRNAHLGEGFESLRSAAGARRVKHGDAGADALGQISVQNALHLAGAKFAIGDAKRSRLPGGEKRCLAVDLDGMYHRTVRRQGQRDRAAAAVEVEDDVVRLQSRGGAHQAI